VPGEEHARGGGQSYGDGKSENVKAGQEELRKRAKADGEASLGRYVAGSCVGAAAAYDLFIKNHAY